MTHLGSLTDEELIARVRISQVADPMERELARRLASRLDELEALYEEIKNRKDDE